MKVKVVQLSEVCQAETSMVPARVRKAIFHVLDNAKTIDGMKDVEKETTDDEDARRAFRRVFKYRRRLDNEHRPLTLEKH